MIFSISSVKKSTDSFSVVLNNVKLQLYQITTLPRRAIFLHFIERHFHAILLLLSFRMPLFLSLIIRTYPWPSSFHQWDSPSRSRSAKQSRQRAMSMMRPAINSISLIIFLYFLSGKIKGQIWAKIKDHRRSSWRRHAEWEGGSSRWWGRRCCSCSNGRVVARRCSGTGCKCITSLGIENTDKDHWNVENYVG